MSNQPFTIERLYNAPLATVWHAITDKNAMKQWYFDLDKFEPVVGFEFSFAGKGNEGQNYIHHCRITEVVIEKKLSYSWTYENYEGYLEVTFELFAEGNKTKVTLTHAGIESFPRDNKDFAKESFAKGWTWLIETGLQGYLDKYQE